LSWEGRFDDPRKTLDPNSRFRTLYVAQERVTAFRETLQDLRPDTHSRAEYLSLFGVEPPPGIVTAQWRADRRVARGRLAVAATDLVDLEDLDVRRELEQSHAAVLASHGMRHLDISNLRSSQRIVTQTIALDLWTQGKAGVLYKSNIDSGVCLALFEGGPPLSPYGRTRRIAADDADLLAAVEPWHLDIEPD
jgi:hypothetical protein